MLQAFWSGCLVVCLLLSGDQTFAAESKAEQGRVQLKKTDQQTVDVLIDGKLFTTYRFAKDLPKPYFYPVNAADGTLLSRPIVGTGGGQTQDHKHHKGIWFSVDEVNEVDFWAEASRIENQSVEITANNASTAVLHVVNHWLKPNGKPTVREVSRISISADRLITYDATFDAAFGPVHFGDTKEGLFGFRMVDVMREKETGKVVNSEGKQGTKECWGKAARWVDYVGTIEGKSHGVAIFDHPENFRPSRYHVRNYGLFSVSPFGEKAYAKNDPAEKHLQADEQLRLRYGMYFHTGNAQQAKIESVYKNWAKGEK